MIDYTDLSVTEECFTHVDDDGKQTTFAVARFRAHCEASTLQVWRLPVEPEQAEFCLKNRGVEPHRLKRLRAEDLKKPLLFVRFDNMTHLMIDGTHRYVRLYQLGVPECRAWIIEERMIWEQFVVGNYPSLSNRDFFGWSGIL